MSPPEPDPRRKERRLRGRTIGILVVIAAVGLIVVYQIATVLFPPPEAQVESDAPPPASLQQTNDADGENASNEVDGPGSVAPDVAD